MNEHPFTIEEYKNLLLQNPNSFDLNFNIAVLYHQKKDFKNAAKFAFTAYEIMPNERSILIILTTSLIHINQKKKAIKLLEEYLQINDFDAELLSYYKNITGKTFKGKKTKTAINESPGIKSNEVVRESVIKSLAERRLNILFVQDAPCIRNYKYAKALQKRGHNITLAYTIKKLSERYNGLSDDVYVNSIKMMDASDIWKLADKFDIIHSHNEPDHFTVAALASNKPVIHDTHDLISLREPENTQLKYFEGIANRAAHGRIYSTQYQQREAENLYNVNGSSLIYYNYASENHIPSAYLEKKSSRDGKLHCVYEGGISDSNGKHRDFSNQFVEMSLYGINIHIYPAAYDKNLAEYFSAYSNIFYYHPVSPEKLIEEMTQYDFGIIPWNLEKGNKRFLDSTIANKLFEYLSAGLPVATADIQSYNDFFKKYDVGVTFSSIEELVSQLHSILDKGENVRQYLGKFTYENEIEKLENFYYSVIDNHKIYSKDAGVKPVALLNNDLDKKETIPNSLEKLLNWIEVNGYKGYDPYDAEDYIISKEKSGNSLSEAEKNEIRFLNDTNPKLCREKYGIPPKINAKAQGLLLASYTDLYRVLNENRFLEKAKEIAEWLVQNRSGNFENYCWGYPFDWQSKVFIPMGTPSAVVTTIVGDGFWKLYKTTLEDKYLDVCNSICRFILEDLKIDEIDTEKICFSYTPIDDFHVHNANLFAAEFLARIGKELDNHDYIEYARKSMNYTLSEQNEDGSIFYWGKIQDYHNSKHLDSYHSGFEIRALASLFESLGELRIKEAYLKYLSFFIDSYILDDGAILQFPKKKNNPQVNVHGVAEGILLSSILLPELSELKGYLDKMVEWATINLQHTEGWFGYIVRNEQKIMFPYFRWGQAWMLRGLTEYFKAEKILTGEWGYYNRYTDSPGIKAEYHKSKSYNELLNEYKALLLQFKENEPDSLPLELLSEAKKLMESRNVRFGSDEELFSFIVNSDNESSEGKKEPPKSLFDDNYKNFHLMMPEAGHLKYGSKEWTEYLYKNSETDPWGQDWRASQQIRYLKGVELISKHIKKDKPISVLDIGCALGEFIKLIKSRWGNANFTGVDISSEAIKKDIQNYPDVRFLQDQLPDLFQTHGEQFDLITALEVIYYVNPDEMLSSLSTLKNKLKNDGYLLISSYLNQPPFLTPADFKDFVEKEFIVIDEILRYHKPYYKLESPLRIIMSELNNKQAEKYKASKETINDFLNASFNLLSSTNLIEDYNNEAKESGLPETVSHSILLARKR